MLGSKYHIQYPAVFRDFVAKLSCKAEDSVLLVELLDMGVDCYSLCLALPTAQNAFAAFKTVKFWYTDYLTTRDGFW